MFQASRMNLQRMHKINQRLLLRRDHTEQPKPNQTEQNLAPAKEPSKNENLEDKISRIYKSDVKWTMSIDRYGTKCTYHVVKMEKLGFLEALFVRSVTLGDDPNLSRCEYDTSSLKLYKIFVRRPVPEGSRELGLLDWYIIGECTRCDAKRQVTLWPNGYL